MNQLSKIFPSLRKSVILYYHRVVPQMGHDPLMLKVSVRHFREQLEFLMKSFKIISLEELLIQIQNQYFEDSRQAVVTFDDGYWDNYEFAFPVLKELGISATFFVVTDAIEKGEYFWWDRFTQSGVYQENNKTHDTLKKMVSTERDQKMKELVINEDTALSNPDRPMNWSEVRKLSEAGFSIGSHTRSHPVLTLLSREEMMKEVVQSKFKIEEMTQKKIILFSYPYGEKDCFNAVSRECIIEAGYQCALVTLQKPVSSRNDPYTLGRVVVRDEDGPIFLRRIERVMKSF